MNNRSVIGRYNLGYAADEKKWFTEQREINLNRYDPETRNNILRLEQKFGKICFTPLDIPRITDQKFVDWYFENAVPSIKQNKDVATGYTGGSSFLTMDVIPKGHDSSRSVWSKHVVPELEQQWSDLWNQFYEYLPFEKITGLTIWSSTKDIVPHRDQSLFMDIPLEFRVVIDNNPVDNFWISEILPNCHISKKLQTAIVPNNLDTNSFAWSNLRTQHQSKFYPQHKKITFIFHWFNPINWKKYENLLERSYEKYHDNALTSSRDIGDFIQIQS